jgi:cytoskeleton protein RodZ
MNITGELLKSERIKQGLNPQDVALALKLSSKIITSIENGRLEDLPAKTFVRGFVKSYAQLLKMDVDQVMRQFQEEMGSTHPMPKTPPPSATPVGSKNEGPIASTANFKKSPQSTKINSNHSKKTIVYITIAIVLIALIIGVDKVVEKYQRDATLDNAAISQIKPIESTSTPVVSNNNGVSNSSVPSAASSASADASVQEVAAAPLTPPPKNSTPAQAPDNMSTVTLAPEEGFEPSAGKPVEVIIEAKKNVEFLYAKGNSKNFSRLKLQTKQIQVIRSPDGLHLKVDDGGALHLIVNGVEKGAAGANNKPVKLTF